MRIKENKTWMKITFTGLRGRVTTYYLGPQGKQKTEAWGTSKPEFLLEFLSKRQGRAE